MECEINFTSVESKLTKSNFHIVTVPTPINEFKKPDFRHIISASELLAKSLKKNDIVVYESTVFPGATEEIAIPILENISGMKLNRDFSVGYSPERINPADPNHRFENIKKVVSASNLDALKIIERVYGSVVKAGIYVASSIKVAEAAKVIENTQRDLNIALMNEFVKIFDAMGVSTNDVLEAASTKWNFLNFKPGLVGGHCIGVDPYYLTFKSIQVGYYPELVLAGRRINDNMAKWLADRIVLNMIQKKIDVRNSKVLILGFTFKENCGDLRNTKVFDLYKSLNNYNLNCKIVDPIVNTENAYTIYKTKVLNKLPLNEKFDTIILAVAHKFFENLSINTWKKLQKKDSIIFDLKGIVPRELNPNRI